MVIAATKSKLHQVYGFLATARPGREPFSLWALAPAVVAAAATNPQ